MSERWTGGSAVQRAEIGDGKTPAPSLTVAVNDVGPASASWSLDISVMVPDGGWLHVGAVTTSPPSTSGARSRVVAFANVPGAVAWRVSGTGDAGAVADIALGVSSCGCSSPGVVAVAPFSTSEASSTTMGINTWRKRLTAADLVTIGAVSTWNWVRIMPADARLLGASIRIFEAAATSAGDLAPNTLTASVYSSSGASIFDGVEAGQPGIGGTTSNANLPLDGDALNIELDLASGFTFDQLTAGDLLVEVHWFIATPS